MRYCMLVVATLLLLLLCRAPCTDLLAVQMLPEWPAATILLRRFLKVLYSNKGLQHADTAVKLAAVEFTGRLATRLCSEALTADQEAAQVAAVLQQAEAASGAACSGPATLHLQHGRGNLGCHVSCMHAVGAMLQARHDMPPRLPAAAGALSAQTLPVRRTRGARSTCWTCCCWTTWQLLQQALALAAVPRAAAAWPLRASLCCAAC